MRKERGLRIACIYHRIDLDGWMSAAIAVRKFLLNVQVGPSVKECVLEIGDHKINEVPSEELEHKGVCDHDRLFMCGYNYGDEVPNLYWFDKVIMVDISFPKEEMLKLAPKLIWIDHHISAIKENRLLQSDRTSTDEILVKGLRRTNFAACELTWKYFFPNEEMPEIVRLLGRYDCFGHKGTEEEQKVLEFQYGARQCISNYEEAYQKLEACFSPNVNQWNTINPILNSGKAIYAYLCTEAKQSYKNGFEITLKEYTAPEIDTAFIFRSFICINKERFNPINFGIDYHKDGYDGCACFHRTSKGMWAFSLYNDNGKVDCSVIAKSFGGGGHKGASGFIIDDLNKVF